MSARIMESSAIHEFIFGNPLLHMRFSMAIELLARLVVANPRPVTAASLSEASGHSPRAVRALLATLHGSGLICQDPQARDAWSCSAGSGTLTLADIFRSVSEPPPAGRKKPEAADETRSAAQQSVDLLLMQATMSINQIVLQHLQSFDLSRLKAVSPAASLHVFRPRTRAYVAEPV